MTRSLTRVIVALVTFSLLTACGTTTDPEPGQTPEGPGETAAATGTPRPARTPAPTPEPSAYAGAWTDRTADAIGVSEEWSNRVELADIDADGFIDILFANGGDYETPGTPVPSQVFLNRGDGTFEDVTASVFGDLTGLTRVIKVVDLDGDGNVDIVLGNTFQTQSRLFLGNGDGTYTDVTETHLPQGPLSVGDIAIGDVDGDGDLDMALAHWGDGNPMAGTEGRTQLWLNDGDASFTDATEAQMPDTLVGFSWDLEFVDIDNDWDLDLAISCKMCPTSLLYENDGSGTFTDVTDGRMPSTNNNYQLGVMDLDGDGYLDFVTINDNIGLAERIFRNDGSGSFEDVTGEWWPDEYNPGWDDNGVVFIDIDSDGDADLLIGSLDGPDRLLINDGSGRITDMAPDIFDSEPSRGTLGMLIADLDGDGLPDVVESQGEVPGHEDNRVYFGTSVLSPDTAPPVIATDLADPAAGQLTVHARVHDNRTPNMPHDWQAVVVRWMSEAGADEAALQWYGENLFRASVELPADASEVQVCATDAAGNEACSG